MQSFLNAGNFLSKGKIIGEKNLEKKFIFSHKNNLEKFFLTLNFLKLIFEKLECFSQAIDYLYNGSGNYICDYKFLYTKNLNKYQIENKKTFTLKVGDKIFIDDLSKKLNDFGYVFSEYIDTEVEEETSVFNKLGDIITIRIKNSKELIKISFWGDEIESIFHSKDKKTITLGEVFQIENLESGEEINSEILELFKNQNIILDNLDIYDSNFANYFENGISFDLLKSGIYKQTNLGITDLYIENIEKLKNIITSESVEIYTQNVQTISNFLEYNNLQAKIIKTKLKFFKSYQAQDRFIICDDIISKIFIKKRIKKNIGESFDLLMSIKPGDFIVHIDHGVGIFNKIIQKQIGEKINEYIEIEYKNNDKLFVPIVEIKRLSKYIGVSSPKLTSLSGKDWTNKIKKVSEEAENIAHDLLELYAQRQSQKGFSFYINEKKGQDFIDSFSYPYTPDQQKSVDDILQDMQKEIPMDRVLVGDVGFGKTEVAFNAIFHAFLNKKQSVLISPLVVLAYQHYQKALERFSEFGLKIEILTRYETSSSTKRVFEKLKNGEVDLVVGTHKLLSDKIRYKDLGLLIVDEEHKFGVLQKEQIKKLSKSVDILSMSATPIPRSLNMALSGIKDVSIISTAPSNRKGVETFVSNFSDNVIKEAGTQEFQRGGQLFFIHNRVQTIENMKINLQKIFPDKKIIVTHGQLEGNDLEDRIMAFKRKEYDILLSSTVIENGIDLPNVNTIFINDAYRFGISQIHQLRGRVGRKDKKGYCYLLFNKDKLKEDAAKRLQTIVDYSHLGAGFELAMKDLEIRGGGDILGVKQSGNVMDIGVTTYLKLLEDKVQELKNKDNPQNNKNIETKMDLNISVYIDDKYFNSELDKINFYREIEYVDNLADLEEIGANFKEINPEIDIQNHNLFKLLKVKIKAGTYKIESIKRNGVSYEVNFVKNATQLDLKKFLEMDEKVYFIVKSLEQVKVPAMKFKGDDDFLNYLESIFFKKKKKKIKLKAKKSITN